MHVLGLWEEAKKNQSRKNTCLELAEKNTINTWVQTGDGGLEIS